MFAQSCDIPDRINAEGEVFVYRGVYAGVGALPANELVSTTPYTLTNIRTDRGYEGNANEQLPVPETGPYSIRTTIRIEGCSECCNNLSTGFDDIICPFNDPSGGAGCSDGIITAEVFQSFTVDERPDPMVSLLLRNWMATPCEGCYAECSSACLRVPTGGSSGGGGGGSNPKAPTRPDDDPIQ